jgi:histidinol-phosphate/aromatic aminotransferase/cobyric acid decarboxylase-like protein
VLDATFDVYAYCTIELAETVEVEFVAADLNKDLNSADMSCYLLEKYNILIKDLSNKQGLHGGFWVRFAIRDRKDNDLLIEKLYLFKSVKRAGKGNIN